MRVARPTGFGKSECSAGHSIPSEPHRLVLANTRKPEHLRCTPRISVQGGLHLIRLITFRAGRLFVRICFVILVTTLSGLNIVPVPPHNPTPRPARPTTTPIPSV